MISLATGDRPDLQGNAYHQDVAMRLIGAGGVSGYGLGQSRMVIRHNHLPHDHNDSIFAVLVNRWGLLGAWAVLGLYLALFTSILTVAGNTKDPFARLACVGFAGMIFTQAAINVAMFINLLPVTGITLPFVSYGGSSLLATFAMVGLVINFATHRPAPLTRPSFEFDNADAIFQ
jgi:cell division protein FtsW (lipid II flippase)